MKDGKYLEYAIYKQFGGSLSRESFLLYEYRAAKELDRYTFHRIDGSDEDIQRCIFELIKNIQTKIEEAKGISSESIDGYSVTYADIQTIIEENSQDIKNTINIYMDGKTNEDGIPLLFRGRK